MEAVAGSSYHRTVRTGSVVIVALCAARASADPAVADKLAAEAATKADHSDFPNAATKYREAYAADPRPDFMCNVGIAYYKAKDLTRAERYLEQCEQIGKALDAKFLDSVAKVHKAVNLSLIHI